MQPYVCRNKYCVPFGTGNEFKHYQFNQSCLDPINNFKINTACIDKSATKRRMYKRRI